jgi:hypothetical protein
MGKVVVFISDIHLYLVPRDKKPMLAIWLLDAFSQLSAISSCNSILCEVPPM